jgi:hypothetical protein
LARYQIAPRILRGAAHFVAAFRLGLIQRLVGGLQQAFRHIARGRIDRCYAAAYCGPNAHIVGSLGRIDSREASQFHHLAQALGHLDRRGLRRGREQDDELFTAESRCIVILHTQCLLQQGTDSFENLIAIEVAIAIVQLLEVIHIDQNHRQ